MLYIQGSIATPATIFFWGKNEKSFLKLHMGKTITKYLIGVPSSWQADGAKGRVPAQFLNPLMEVQNERLIFLWYNFRCYYGKILLKKSCDLTFRIQRTRRMSAYIAPVFPMLPTAVLICILNGGACLSAPPEGAVAAQPRLGESSFSPLLPPDL